MHSNLKLQQHEKLASHASYVVSHHHRRDECAASNRACLTLGSTRTVLIYRQVVQTVTCRFSACITATAVKLGCIKATRSVRSVRVRSDTLFTKNCLRSLVSVWINYQLFFDNTLFCSIMSKFVFFPFNSARIMIDDFHNKISIEIRLFWSLSL